MSSLNSEGINSVNRGELNNLTNGYFLNSSNLFSSEESDLNGVRAGRGGPLPGDEHSPTQAKATSVHGAYA